ncbi:MAG: serine/threonine-protein kinase [Bacteroidales bacterium]|nr:serine/threonine-protein kinase [Bacteroidales bacterium]
MNAHSDTLATGTVLGGLANSYTIVNVIGRGGFGITYRATARGYARTATFAIKEYFIASMCGRGADMAGVIYDRQASADYNIGLRAFLREARRLQASGPAHPGIVDICDIFEANGTAYCVMEYLEGESLSDYVNRVGALSLDETTFFLSPITDALTDLHSRRITHLNINPASIMLAHTGNGSLRPVLTDFGFSRHYDEIGRATSTLISTGYMPGYAPPEQYGGITAFSPACDVYALAATYYFCLTGRTPEISSEVDRANIDAGLRQLAPPHIRAAIVSAMNRNPRRRPADAAAFAASLERFIPETTMPPRPVRKIERVSRPEHRPEHKSRRSIYAVCAGAALLLAAGLAAVLWPAPTPQETIQQKPAETDNARVEVNTPQPRYIPDNQDTQPTPARKADRGFIPSSRPTASDDNNLKKNVESSSEPDKKMTETDPSHPDLRPAGKM